MLYYYYYSFIHMWYIVWVISPLLLPSPPLSPLPSLPGRICSALISYSFVEKKT
jgi:hypothetical protein